MASLRQLIHEIHRRSLWQVLGIYAVASWIIYQVVLALFEGLGLPDWVPGTALVLLLIGLPIVLGTAFVQEGGPGGEPMRGELAARGADRGELESAGESEAAPVATTSTTKKPAPGILFTWPRVITGGVLAFAGLGFAAAGFMGMRALGVGPAATLISSGELSERDVLVLAEFENETEDESLARVVTEGLWIQLSQSPVLRLADEADIERVLERMRRGSEDGVGADLAREIAAREGYKAVIVGTVTSAGGQYLFSARLVNAADGHALATFGSTARDAFGIIDAVDALGREIREEVGESLRTIRSNEPLARVSTGSLEALRRYTDAQRLAHRGDVRAALSLWEEATAIDSTFAMAYRKVGITAVNMGLPRERWEPAFTRAHELRDRFSEVERQLAIGTYYVYVEQDRDRSIQAYRRILEIDPDHIIALNNLALILAGQARNEEAVTLLQRVIEIRPIPVSWTNLAARLADMGRIDSARTVLDNAARALPDVANIGHSRLSLEATYGDPDAARAMADSLAAAHPDDALIVRTAEIRHFHLDASHGRLREAIEHSRRRRQILDEQDRPDMAALEAVRPAFLLALHELPDRARAEADRVAEMADSLATLNSFVHVWLAVVYTIAGDADAARAHLAARAEIVEDPGEEGPWRDRALIARAEGRHRDALDARVRADRIAACLDECDFRFHGELYERLAMPDSAIAAYEKFTDDDDLARIGTWAYDLPAVLLHLAALHDDHGDPERAAVLYNRYVERMADADPEFQSRVDAARRALQRLVGEGGP